MTVAAFVLAIVGTITAAVSLTWNILTFLWQGARPKLTPIVGFRSSAGLIYHDATLDNVRELLEHAAQQVPAGAFVVGVKVINAGRASFHVAEWGVSTMPNKTSFKTLESFMDSPTVPCDISPGASQIFFTELNAAYALRAADESVYGKSQRVVVTVSSGGRTYTTKPVSPGALALGAP